MHRSWIRAPAVSNVLGMPEPPESVGGKPMPLDFFVSQLEASRSHDPDPLASWMSGERIDMHLLGDLGALVLSKTTLGEALKALANGFAVVQSNTDIHVTIDGDEAHVVYRLLDPRIWPRRADAELTLGLIAGLCDHFVPRRDALLDVCFEHQTDRDPRHLAKWLGCTPRFGQEENRLTLSTRALSQRRRDPIPVPPVENRWKLIETALIEQRRATPVSHRVRELILSQIGRQAINQQAVATQLGMSERSLRRSLATEGAPFHDILEECRRMHGFALLVRSDRQLSEIALLLGYSDQTAFSRAFSRWYGVPPRELRRSGAIEESVIR